MVVLVCPPIVAVEPPRGVLPLAVVDVSVAADWLSVCPPIVAVELPRGVLPLAVIDVSVAWARPRARYSMLVDGFRW